MLTAEWLVCILAAALLVLDRKQNTKVDIERGKRRKTVRGERL